MEQTTCAYYLPISHKNGKSISATHNNINNSYELRTKFGTWRRDILMEGGPLSVLQWWHLGQTFLGIVLGIVLGWAPIGFAVMPTPGPSQDYFGHT